MRPRLRMVVGVLAVLVIAVAGVGYWLKVGAGLPLKLSGQPAHTAGDAALVGAPGGPPVPTAAPSSAAPPTNSSPPVHLSIPALKVEAAAEPVGVDAQGRMAVPSKAEDVGWYQLGPIPGDPGNAVIDGHLDWWTTGAAVFWQLARLKVGDTIVVTRANGQTVQFLVDGSTTVPSDSRPPGLFDAVGPPTLSLITCSGSWDRQRQTYATRLVVHASLAPSRPTQTPGDGG